MQYGKHGTNGTDNDTITSNGKLGIVFTCHYLIRQLPDESAEVSKFFVLTCR